MGYTDIIFDDMLSDDYLEIKSLFNKEKTNFNLALDLSKIKYFVKYSNKLSYLNIKFFEQSDAGNFLNNYSNIKERFYENLKSQLESLGISENSFRICLSFTLENKKTKPLINVRLTLSELSKINSTTNNNFFSLLDFVDTITKFIKLSICEFKIKEAFPYWELTNFEGELLK